MYVRVGRGFLSRYEGFLIEGVSMTYRSMYSVYLTTTYPTTCIQCVSILYPIKYTAVSPLLGGFMCPTRIQCVSIMYPTCIHTHLLPAPFHPYHRYIRPLPTVQIHVDTRRRYLRIDTILETSRIHIDTMYPTRSSDTQRIRTDARVSQPPPPVSTPNTQVPAAICTIAPDTHRIRTGYTQIHSRYELYPRRGAERT